MTLEKLRCNFVNSLTYQITGFDEYLHNHNNNKFHHNHHDIRRTYCRKYNNNAHNQAQQKVTNRYTC